LKEASKARRGKYDAKRKILVEELEERERALKKSKTDQVKAEAERLQETERIRVEGRRMREARERELLQAEEEAKQAAEEREKELAPPPLGVLFSILRSIREISQLYHV
jgi:DnaJ homolog subfamily C member 17